MRPVFAALALSLACLAPALALAEEAPSAVVHAKHGKHAKADKKGMPADRFRQQIEGRIARARDRLEQHIERKRLAEPKAAALRADFNTGVSQVRAKVESVSKDGVVSRDEAREVRGMVRQMRSRKH